MSVAGDPVARDRVRPFAVWRPDRAAGRHGWDGDGDVALQRPVSCRVIAGAVAPALPDDATPGASEGADRSRVFVTALAGLAIEMLCSWVPMSGCCP